MRRILFTLSLLAAAPAAADPGHIATAAGHNHWIAGAVMGAAALIALWRAIKAAQQAGPEAETENDEQGDEAEA